MAFTVKRPLRLNIALLDEFKRVVSDKNTSGSIRKLIDAYISGQREKLERQPGPDEFRQVTILLSEDQLSGLEAIAGEAGVGVEKCVNLMMEREVAMHKSNTEV